MNLHSIIDSMGVDPLGKPDEKGRYSMGQLLETIIHNLNHGWDYLNDEKLAPEEKEFIFRLENAIDMLD